MIRIRAVALNTFREAVRASSSILFLPGPSSRFAGLAGGHDWGSGEGRPKRRAGKHRPLRCDRCDVSRSEHRLEGARQADHLHDPEQAAAALAVHRGQVCRSAGDHCGRVADSRPCVRLAAHGHAGVPSGRVLRQHGDALRTHAAHGRATLFSASSSPTTATASRCPSS